ncbi:hypothetical protein BT69DRAFT_829290 [Atractiella rhizophila]|nr:hypothetical protein BT69DRAFT_829290 [Atractiella rhizophila]
MFYRPEPWEILIILPKLDQLSSSTNFGINHKFALDVCRVLANDSGGHFQNRANVKIKDSVVTLGESECFYYSEGRSKYPVVASFRGWKPPDNPPEHWTQALEALWPPPDQRSRPRAGVPASEMSEISKADGKCVITLWCKLSSW